MADDLDFSNSDEEEIELGDVDEDDEETATFKFKVPADFEDGNYKLAIKAYGDDEGEEDVCADTSSDLDSEFFQIIDVNRETDEENFIAFDNFRSSPTPATCGDTVGVTVDVFNIGDEDQEQVKVNLDIRDLGISLSREIKTDLDQGDDEQLSFTFTIPNTAEDKTYSVEMDAEYEFDDGIYEERLEDSEVFQITVTGCSLGGSAGSSRIAGISASLESGAEAGEELVVRSSITNLNTETTSFVVDASGFNTWASLESVSNRILTLSPGESRDVSFRFSVDEDTDGEQSFVIEARAGEKVETREVSVDISGDSSSDGFEFDLGGNALAWVIGAINLILIILIIVVAVKISRR